jgi:hypothetical protein
MLKPKNLHLEIPGPVRTLLKLNTTQDTLHPVIYEATDPEDIMKRKVTDDLGIKVVRDGTNGRQFLVGYGVKNRSTTMSSMGFNNKPDTAIIMFSELTQDQARIYKRKEQAYREHRQ